MEKQNKSFPYKYLVLGVPIVLSLFASIPAIIAIKTNNKEYRAAARVAEARIQLKEIVDLVLKSDELNLNFVELGYNPEGKLENVYGLNPTCFPKFKNTNMFEMSQLEKPIPLFKWGSEILEQKPLLEKTFLNTPCPADGQILIYALYADEDKSIKGWTIDLQKNIQEFKGSN